MHNFECGQEIPKEEDEEGECQHKYLPLLAFLVAGELKQRDGIVELPELETGRQAALNCQLPCRPMWKAREMDQAPQHPRPTTQNIDTPILRDSQSEGPALSIFSVPRFCGNGDGPGNYLRFSTSPAETGPILHYGPGRFEAQALKLSQQGARWG